MKNDIAKVTKSIVKLDALIVKLYNELYNLEINNKKSSEEFKDTLNNLRLTIELQKNSINELHITESNYYTYINCIATTPLRKYIDDDNIIQLDTFRDRLYNYFTDKLTPKDIPSDFSIELELDTQTTILDAYNIQKEIIKYPTLKEDLLKNIYNKSYLYSVLEEKMLMNNFTLGHKNSITIDQELRIHNYNIPKEYMIEKEKQSLVADFESIVNGIIIDDDSMDKDNFSRCIVNKCELKSNVTLQFFLYNHPINQLYKFNKGLENNYSKEEKDKKSISIGIVMDAIKESILENDEYFYANSDTDNIYTKK